MKTSTLLMFSLLLCLPFFAAKAAETEPNNTRNTANILALNGSETGAINISGDEDWWSVTTDANGQLNITLAISNSLTLRCQLYDNDGTTLLTSDYTAGTKSFLLNGLSAGTYYLRVYPFYVGQLPAYTISNTLTLPAQSNDTEPNGSRELAKTLALNNSTTGHIGYYYNLQRDTADWYKITTNANGRLRLTLSSHNGQTVYAYLYDNNGTTEIAKGYTAGTATVVNADGLAAGTYYVRINAFYNYQYAPYTIADSLFKPEQANDSEPNGSREQAKTLALNNSTTGHIGYYYNLQRDTADWYKITTNADGRLRLTLSSNNGQTVYAYLYDNNGTTEIAKGYTAGTAAVVNADGLAAGTYYVRVNAFYTYGYAPYTIADSLFKPEQANDSEPNGSRELAITLPLNGSRTGHAGYYYNNSRDTTDWYKLTTNADGMISATIQSHNGKNIYAYIYDNNGTRLFASGYTTTSKTLLVDGLKPGTYYLLIRCFYSNEWVPYTLSNTLTTYANADDNQAEPNEFYSQAKTIPANDSVTGHVNFYYNGQRDTEDRWKINYTGSGNLTLKFNQENRLYYGSTTSVYFRVYKDTNASPIAGSYYSANSTTLNLTGLTQGYYYIRVYTFYGTELTYLSSYSITATFTQINTASITQLRPIPGTSCTNNRVRFQCSGSQAPYKVQLYRFGTAYGNAITINSTSTFTINNLPPGKYYATAFGDGATGTAFGTSSSRDAVPPPTNIAVTNITANSAKVSWTSLPTCIKGFSVQWRILSSNSPWSQKTLAGSATQTNLTGLLPDTAYEWRIAAADTGTTQSQFAISPYVTDTFNTTSPAAIVAINSGDENAKSYISPGTVKIFPNPAVSQFVLQTGIIKAEGNVSLCLFDMNGSAKWRGTIPASQLSGYRVNISSLSPGTYLLQVKDKGNRLIAAEKVMIQR